MPDLLAPLHDTLASLALTPALVAGALGAVLAAALLRGFTGFGFSLAAVPMLGLVMAPAEAVPVALGLQFLGGLIDLPGASRDSHWPSLRWLIAGAVLGSPAGALVLSIVPASVARIVIAAITAAAVVLLGRGFAIAAIPQRMATILVGLVAGVFNGLAAMPGPPAVVYYMSGPFGRVAARASLLVFFLATSISALASLAMLGLLDRRVVVLSVAGLPVMALGTWIGELGFRHGSATLHRQVSVASLGVIALGSALKGVSELI
ncbi:MAG: sulfite exporter TauE/SafE family protein [Pseudomonadota bacterium]